jgi:Holliday junction DNA helicase RuvB
MRKWFSSFFRDSQSLGHLLASNEVSTEPLPPNPGSAVPLADVAPEEIKLSPRRLRDFVGQAAAKQNLLVAIDAALSRDEPLDHVLLSGPSGLGKATLACIIANEMGAMFQRVNVRELRSISDVTPLLTNLRENQVLFVDELNELRPPLHHLLIGALDDYNLDITIGQGPSARMHTIALKPFTLIGTTTRPTLSSARLQSRFGIVLRLQPYTAGELAMIVRRSAEVLGVEIEDEGAAEIAAHCGGTPLEANRVVRRARDYAQVRGAGRIDKATARAAIELIINRDE